MDIENMGSAPDIDNFDASKLDRGDNLIVAEKATEPAKVEDKVSDIFEGKGEGAKVEGEPAAKVEGEGEPAAKVDEAGELADKGEDDKGRDDKGRFEAKIPKSRFDEAVGKEREAREAAERRAAEAERKLQEGQAAQVRTYQIDAIEADIANLEQKHADLLLDGNAKEAAAVMKEIRMAERRIARAESDAIADQRVTRTLETQKFDTVVARIEADYPEFNPDSDKYDTDLVGLVLAKQGNLIRSEGMTPSAAMEKAAKDVAERFLKTGEVEAKVEEKKGLASTQAADRKQEQVAKNLEASQRQPASMKDAGIDSDKAGKTSSIDVNTMSADELAALPEATRQRLRGDFV